MAAVVIGVNVVAGAGTAAPPPRGYIAAHAHPCRAQPEQTRVSAPCPSHRQTRIVPPSGAEMEWVA